MQKPSNNQGIMLLEALIAAAILGVVAISLIFAFGASTDMTNASTDYAAATALAQRQLDIIENDQPVWNDYVEANWDTLTINSATYLNMGSSPLYNAPVIEAVAGDYKATFAFAEGTTVYAKAFYTNSDGLIKCKVIVSWSSQSVAGAYDKNNNTAKSNQITVTRFFKK